MSSQFETPAAFDLDQHLVFTEGARFPDLERLDGATKLFDPGYSHRRTPIVNAAYRSQRIRAFTVLAGEASGESRARRRKDTVGVWRWRRL